MPGLISNSRGLILCESSNCWSVAWKRALHGWEVKMVETRSLVQCAAALRESPESLVGIEVGADEEALALVIPAVVELQQRFAGAPFMALADRRLVAADLFLRDAGFMHVIYSRREVPAAVRWVRRHLQFNQLTATTSAKE